MELQATQWMEQIWPIASCKYQEQWRPRDPEGGLNWLLQVLYAWLAMASMTTRIIFHRSCANFPWGVIACPWQSLASYPRDGLIGKRSKFGIGMLSSKLRKQSPTV